MIHPIAEYCLNTLNGTLFDSIDSIMNSKRLYTDFIPHVAIYIAFIGVNTFDISAILSHSILLYSLFSKIDHTFSHYIHSNIPFIPFIFSFILHLSYISPIKKFRSLLSRILYSMVYYFTDILFTDILFNTLSDNTVVIVLKHGVKFLINFTVMKFSTYSTYKSYISSFILSFCGSYFFFKTYKKSNIFKEYLTDYEFKFDSFDILSYVLFFTFLIISFLVQMIIGYIIMTITIKIKSKRKRD